MILVTGGARSGKSSFSERKVNELAQSKNSNVLYIATSLVFDEEMAKRVELHKLQRPQNWHTYEGYQDLPQVINEQSQHYGAILLECITTMLTNLLFDQAKDCAPEDMDFVTIEAYLNTQIDALITACEQSCCEVVIVTNELGLGIVPENRLARHFRDIAGRVNQRLAAHASEVYFVVSGIEIKIKG